MIIVTVFIIYAFLTFVNLNPRIAIANIFALKITDKTGCQDAAVYEDRCGAGFIS